MRFGRVFGAGGHKMSLLPSEIKQTALSLKWEWVKHSRISSTEDKRSAGCTWRQVPVSSFLSLPQDHPRTHYLGCPHSVASFIFCFCWVKEGEGACRQGRGPVCGVQGCSSPLASLVVFGSRCSYFLSSVTFLFFGFLLQSRPIS